MERKPSRRSYGRSTSRNQKTWQHKCKDYIREFVAFMFTNVGIIGLVIGYTIIGAFLFIHIEGKQKDGPPNKFNITKFRSNASDMLWDMTCCKINLFNETLWKEHVAARLLLYQRDFVKEVLDGYNPKTDEPWSFSGAFLYSLTVITTIGYGNVAPRTIDGKLATIVYAIIGMPLFLLYLSNIGDIFAKSFKWIYSQLCLCQLCPKSFKRRRRRRHKHGDESPTQEWQMSRMGPNRKGNSDGTETEDEDSDDEEDSDEAPESDEDRYDPQTITVPLTLCLAIMVGYVCGGAILFSTWEDWGFLDGSYFCFISLSTIGFGDIVPGESIYQSDAFEMSFILTAVYLMLGMALIAMCFNLMQEEVIHKVRTLIRTCRAVFTCCGRKKAQPVR